MSTLSEINAIIVGFMNNFTGKENGSISDAFESDFSTKEMYDLERRLKRSLNSINKEASRSTFEFPLFCSSSLSQEVIFNLKNALEKKYAVLLRLYLESIGTVNLSKGETKRSFIDKVKRLMLEDSKFDDDFFINDLKNEDFDGFKHKDINIFHEYSRDELANRRDARQEKQEQREAEKFKDYQKRQDEREKRDIAKDKLEQERRDREEQRQIEKDRLERERADRREQRDTRTEIRNIEKDRLEQKRKNREEFRANRKEARDIEKDKLEQERREREEARQNRREAREVELHNLRLKEIEDRKSVYERAKEQSLDATLKLQTQIDRKLYQMEPTIIQVDIEYFTGDTGSIQRDRLLIGVKVHPILISSESLLRVLPKARFDENFWIRAARAVTGEKKFFRDLLLRIDDIKKVQNSQTDKWYHELRMIASKAKNKSSMMKNSAIANASIAVTLDEAEYMRKESRFDLIGKKSDAERTLNALGLINLVIVDEARETLLKFSDSYRKWESISFKNIESSNKGMNDKDMLKIVLAAQGVR